METLKEPVQQKPTSYVNALELIASLWGSDGRSKVENENLDWNTYLEYYEKQCGLALYDRGRHIYVRTHQDIIDIAERLTHGSAKADIATWLSGRFVDHNSSSDKDMLNASIDLPARLVSMMDIGVLPYCVPVRSGILWEQGPLQERICKYFHVPEKFESKVKLEKSFNGRNLQRLAGIRIIWTSNLADHLRIIGDRVAIFHHASFLKCQQKSPLFPPGFVEETLQTLALLFPQYDKATIKWVEQRKKLLAQHLDEQLINCGHLKAQDRRIERFRFWRERLADLKEFYEECSPRTLPQLWRDKRNGVRWYTFWLAMLILVLTVLFGIVQCVEGGLQVYKAYHPTDTKQTKACVQVAKR